MQVIIQDQVKEEFRPIIGVATLSGFNNKEVIPGVDYLLFEAVELTQEVFSEYDSIANHPQIAIWHDAMKKFGADPREYPSSVEALVHRVMSSGSIPRINTLVDLCNYVSLKHVLPFRGKDLDAVEGDITLAYATGEEGFVELGREDNTAPEEKEVIYTDDKGAICRRWNWREAERTRLRTTSTNAVIMVDALPPVSSEVVEAAIKELAGLTEQYCKGVFSFEIID